MKQNDEVERIMLSKAPPKHQPYPKHPVMPEFEGAIGILVATGPSLTPHQLKLLTDLHTADHLRDSVKVFSINNVYMVYPKTDVHLSCDGPWWRWYWPKSKELRELPCPKYTWYPEIAEKFGINYIKAIVKDGLSTDPGIVHINHGSGPMMMNLAYHYGIREVYLLGHDMRFAPDYNAQRRHPGSFPRHYFGEYPKPLQHWPSVKVKPDGKLEGLIETYRKMPFDELGMTVTSCTPDSALHEIFPYRPWEEVVDEIMAA